MRPDERSTPTSSEVKPVAIYANNILSPEEIQGSLRSQKELDEAKREFFPDVNKEHLFPEDIQFLLYGPYYKKLLGLEQ